METTATNAGKLIGRILSVVIVIGALILALVVIERTNHNPRTDDSEILANFIGIAPQVEGPIVRLAVHDNELVDSGALLLLGPGQGMRVAGVRTIMPGESVRDRIVALVDGQPGHTLVVAGSRVDADAIPDGLPVHWCDPATYCTSVWVELAEHRDTWRAKYSAVVLCDSEPRSGRTHLALLAGPTFSAVPEGVRYAGFRHDS